MWFSAPLWKGFVCSSVNDFYAQVLGDCPTLDEQVRAVVLAHYEEGMAVFKTALETALSELCRLKDRKTYQLVEAPSAVNLRATVFCGCPDAESIGSLPSYQ